jgi:type IV secretion system protein VirB6
MMILGGFLTGGLGIVFTVGAFIFAFFLLSLTIRAIHIFLLSITAVVTLLFISPIPIVLMMFNRGRPIFTSWLKQITGFTLQPMILFAYLGILITLFDKVVIGDSVTFSGDGIQAPKDIVCDSAADTSIYCIFKLADIKTLPGLEVIGIGLPALKNMNAAKLQTVIQAAFLMFIFAKFMDQISGFAANLVGGAKLESDWKVSTGDMASKAYSVMKGIQQRGMGAAKKIGGKAARVAGEAFKKVGDRGKAVKRDMGDEGDRTGGAVGGKKIGDIVGGPKDNDEVKGPSDKDKAS